ncbi:TetR family transcriptional regulator [Cohnella rhizosphaerae]|uniref:TetR family transcriptional regulator n=1 Tax=Cohnella rhizosphaerae TaxID=1457232 RepID=UPI0030B90D0F
MTTNYLEKGEDRLIAYDETDSREKLMQAAIDLMADRGFKGVSTKEIAAAAGVSEMTLFRRFGTKLSLLEQTVERYHYADEMTSAFEEKIVWDLGKDLRSIGRIYHEIMARNRKLYRIVLKDDALAGVREKAQRHPKKLLELLTGYLNEMRLAGKLVETDTRMQAMTFMWTHFGAFVSRLYGGDPLSEVSMTDVVESSADLFAKALTPQHAEWRSDGEMDKTASGEAASAVGKTKDAGYQIGVRRTLPVTVEEAWRFLTDAKGMRVWLGEVDGALVREGGELRDAGRGLGKVYGRQALVPHEAAMDEKRLGGAFDASDSRAACQARRHGQHPSREAVRSGGPRGNESALGRRAGGDPVALGRRTGIGADLNADLNADQGIWRSSNDGLNMRLIGVFFMSSPSHSRCDRLSAGSAGLDGAREKPA